MRNKSFFISYCFKGFFLTFIFFLGTSSSPSLSEEISEEKWIEEEGPDPYSIRFGVLVSNDKYQIYRSSLLGEDGLKKLDKHLIKNDLLFPNTIIYMNYAGYEFPFYFALDEYELQGYYGYELFHSFGTPKTYLEGYDPYNPQDDIDKKNALGRKAKKLFEPKEDGLDGDVDDFFLILNMVLDPKRQPVLFHCFGGRHRTGMIAMAIRYLQGGYWLDGPKRKEKGMWLNPAQSEYYEFNHTFFREENIKFIERVSQDLRFIKLKSRYSKDLQDGVLDIRKTDI
jgi:hypothetical protein